MWLQSQTGHIRPSADRRPTELSQTSSVWNNTQLNVQFPPQCLKRQPTRPTVPQSVCSRAGMRRGVRWQVSSFRSRCSAPAAAQPLTCSLNNDANICLKWFMVDNHHNFVLKHAKHLLLPSVTLTHGHHESPTPAHSHWYYCISAAGSSEQQSVSLETTTNKQLTRWETSCCSVIMNKWYLL